jgi:hypothetical protein
VLLHHGYLQKEEPNKQRTKKIKERGIDIIENDLPDGIVEQAPLLVILFFIEVSCQPLERQNPSDFCRIFLAQ